MRKKEKKLKYQYTVEPFLIWPSLGHQNLAVLMGGSINEFGIMYVYITYML